MKWNIFVSIRGPRGSIEVPSTGSPVEQPDMESLLTALPASLSVIFAGLEVVGLRIEIAEAASGVFHPITPSPQ